MKKIMIALAGAASLAALADITSANTVGFLTSSEIKANFFTLCTAPFESMDGSGTIAVKDLVKTTAVAGSVDSASPQLQVWDGRAYVLYYYQSNATVYESDEDEVGHSVTGWADGNGELTYETIPCGTGYWYKVPGEASTFTVSGQVSEEDSFTKEFPADSFQLMGNPYPGGLDLTKVTLSDTVKPGTTDKDSPQLQVWDGRAYVLYYYQSNAIVYESEEDEVGTKVTGWADGNGELATGIVADGTKGLWIKSPTAGTITFAK